MQKARYLLPVFCHLASAILIPLVQTVDRILHASQLLSHAQVGTVEPQNSIQVPDGAVPMLFR